MLRIGAARRNVDIVVEPARLARIETRRRVDAADALAAAALRWPAGPRLHRQASAHVVHHRILHRDLQPPSLAGPLAVVERAEDRDRHQHAGAGVAKGRAGFDRRTVGLAGDADRAARGLRDHVKSQTLLIRAAFAKAFDLAVDDAGVQLPHDIITEPQALDRAGGH